MFDLFRSHQYSHRHYSQMVQKQLAEAPEWTERQLRTEENVPKQSGSIIFVLTTLTAFAGWIGLIIYLII